MTTILAVDIGGTKTILQLVSQDDAGLTCIAEARYDSQSYMTFDEVLGTFLQDAKLNAPIRAACLGVAGPVDAESAKVTNLPWQIHSTSIAEKFSIGKVLLINDFQAAGYGVESLKNEDLFMLQSGKPVTGGVKAIIGAGTGLGVGFMIMDQHGRYQVHPSEGGHAAFAPTDTVQIELLQFLQKEFQHVSCERVLSGPGLENIYRYFDASAVEANKPSISRKNLCAADISHMASDGTNTAAEQALQLFLSVYGAQAGNIALTFMATGGVYIAGGVAPRIKQMFLDSDFIAAFTNKSKMQSLMQEFPVMIVDNPKVGLMGARNVAFHLAR